MTNVIVLSFVYLIGFILLLAFNELNYRRLQLQEEYTRKIAHFTATLAVIPFPYIFPSHWYVLVLALLFFAGFIFTQRKKQLKSIHNINRKSMGSYLLPIGIYLTFLLSSLADDKFLYILPMLILAICDPLAAVLGMNIKEYNGRIRVGSHTLNKTWLGSGSFALMAFIISLIALYFNRGAFDLKTFGVAMAVAVVGTFAELVSWRGSDNVTIPLAVMAVLYVLM